MSENDKTEYVIRSIKKGEPEIDPDITDVFHTDADCIARAKELMQCETCKWWNRDEGPWESGGCAEPCVSEEFAEGDFHPRARFGCHYWESKP